MSPIAKEEVVTLLKDLKIPDFGLLDGPDITGEALITTLARFRMLVSDLLFKKAMALSGQ